METNELLDDSIQDQLILTHESQVFLRETARWGFFLAIIGFIGIGFLLLTGFFVSIAGAFMSGSEFGNLPFPGVMLGLFYIVFGIIYIFPVLYLYRFSNKAKEGLNKQSSELLERGFYNLKSLFKFSGILTIVMIVLYILFIIAALATNFMMFSNM